MEAQKTPTARKKLKYPLTFASKLKEMGGARDPLRFSTGNGIVEPLHFDMDVQNAETSKETTICEKDVGNYPVVVVGKEKCEPDTDSQSNYILIAENYIVVEDALTKEAERYITIRIDFNQNGLSSNRFEIKSTELSNITTIISKKYPYAITGDKKLIENNLRMQTVNLPIIFRYKRGGWHNVNGKWQYIFKGMGNIPNCEIATELDLPVKRQTKSELIVTLKAVMNIYKEVSVSATLLLYSFLGVLYKAFDMAGYPPHFLLFIYGKTGSFKTAMAKIFFIQLCVGEYRKYPRRIDSDTATSLEVALTKYGEDTITLLDDFPPPQNAQHKAEMLRKLETIIRMAGDGSSKSRSNANLEDVRGSGLKGMVVITGEQRMTGLSSNLRCLYCEIEKERVNTDILSAFQRDPFIFTSLIYYFTRFISENWEELVGYIEENYEGFRRQAEKIVSSGRVVDTLVTLWITAVWVQRFATVYCGYNEAAEWGEFLQKQVEPVVIKSEFLAEEENPIKRFMQSLATSVSDQTIVLVERNKKDLILKDADGFTDEQYMYLLPDVTYKKVTNRLKDSKLDFIIDKNQLVKMLCEEGLIIPTSNGAGKKTFYSRIEVNGKKVKFLKISQVGLDHYLNA